MRFCIQFYTLIEPSIYSWWFYSSRPQRNLQEICQCQMWEFFKFYFIRIQLKCTGVYFGLRIILHSRFEQICWVVFVLSWWQTNMIRCYSQMNTGFIRVLEIIESAWISMLFKVWKVFGFQWKCLKVLDIIAVSFTKLESDWIINFWSFCYYETYFRCLQHNTVYIIVMKREE